MRRDPTPDNSALAVLLAGWRDPTPNNSPLAVLLAGWRDPTPNNSQLAAPLAVNGGSVGSGARYVALGREG